MNKQINILEIMETTRSNNYGILINTRIKENFEKYGEAILSFKGIPEVSLNFIRYSIVNLLNDYNLEYIKKNLKIINKSKRIEHDIKRYLKVNPTPHQSKNQINPTYLT